MESKFPFPAGPALTEGGITSAIGRLATPMLVSALLQNLQSLIDLFWVGRLGSVAVASVAMSGTILMVLFPAVMGLSTGTVALVARAVGAGRPHDANAAAGQSLMLSIVLGFVCGAVGWYAAGPMFRLLGSAPEVEAAGEAYLRIALAGTFTMFMLAIGTAALQGAGDALTPMWIMAAANGIHIAINPLLIFGWGPVPAMGVRGAATALVISQAAASMIAVHALVRGRGALRLTLREWTPHAALSWRILRIGIPGAGQMLLRSLMNAVMMRLVAGCGTAAVAAYGIGMRIHMIILMPAFALGGAAATLVGQNLGAGKPQRAHRSAWIATGLDAAIMAASAAAILAFAPALMRAFNQDPEVIAIGVRYLRILSPFYVFVPLGVVLGRALNGAGDSLSPMIFTLISLWGLQVPLAVYLARSWQPSIHGIWWAMAATNVVHGFLTAAWFETGRWKTRKV